MNMLQSPLSKLADQISSHYAAHPDLIASLLERIGSQHIKVGSKEIRASCPLHRGDNPEAFAVWFDRGYVVWKCHTDCNDKGPLGKLLMKRYGCRFEQAVVWLAQCAGIQVTGEMLTFSRESLEEESIEAFNRRRGLGNTQVEQVVHFPEEWIATSQAVLFQPPAAEFLDYLTGPITDRTRWGEKKRQMPLEIIRHFQLGFVPGGSWTFQDHEGQRRGWFEDRISFPWRAMDGRCIGFAGRRLDGVDHLKYKTYPGTKRALALWGLHDPRCLERIKQTRLLNIVEGYTDVTRAYQHGAFNTTALGGTDFTPAQLRLIQSLGLEAVVMFMDRDGPGMTAANKGAEQLRETTKVYLATPPVDHDPDDLVACDQFWAHLAHAQPFIPTRSRRV